MAISRVFSLSPTKITGVYLVFGLLWVSTTDWLVVTIVDSPETVTTLQTLKGWVFVGLSAVLIYGLTRLRQRQIEFTQETLTRATEQLQVFHRVLRHNIRNDLTVIKGNIGFVEEQVSDETHQSSLETARQTAEEIVTVSEKMRIIDKVELSPSSTDAEVNLVELTRDELDSIQETYPEVDISFDAPESAHIHAEPSLRYAIYELLDNAVKHNPNPPERCKVEVMISQDGDRVSLAIEDNGSGIDQEELVPLEAKEETDLTHMSGVGLWLTTWLTEYFDGSLNFEASEGEGTTANLQFDPLNSLAAIGGVTRTMTGPWGDAKNRERAESASS